MKKPKHLRFTASKKQHQLQLAAGSAVASFFVDIQIVVVGVERALRSLQDLARATQDLGRAISSDPEIRQEANLQKLYYQSWQRNELTDTLSNAGIALS
jgi:NADP-dependent 3-hydroxy acid dehydrogenase YdfG